jgi:hypothetical protein
VLRICGISFSAVKLWWLLPIFVGAVFLLNRRYWYYSIAMRIPFSIALADIPQLESQSELKHGKKERLGALGFEEVYMRVPKVYLAGGFHSGWQDKVIQGMLNPSPLPFLFIL